VEGGRRRQSRIVIGLVLACLLASCGSRATPAPDRAHDSVADRDARVPTGYFRDHRYVHPAFRFELDFPNSWPIEDTPAGKLAVASADYMDATVTRSGTHTARGDVEVSFFVDVNPGPDVMEMASEPDLELLSHRRIQVPPANAEASDTTFRYQNWVPKARKRRIVLSGEKLALVVMISHNAADSELVNQLVASMRVN